jgi:hypothetical protein
MILYPTGTCFDDALDFLSEFLKRNRMLATTCELVHGIALARDGEPYSHAWVEQARATVWTAGIVKGEKIYVGVDIDDYYDEMRVQEATRYSLLEAWAENSRTGTYGPWLDKYSRLCRDKKETRHG